MKFSSTIIILFAICHTRANNGTLPDYMTRCDYKDKQINECVKREVGKSLPHFTKGIPELGVPSLDPVELDDIVLDQNSLKLVLKKPKLYGVNNLQMKDLQIDFANDHEADFATVFILNVKLVANYTADGKILVVPIKGEGEATIVVNDITVNLTSKVKHVKDSDGLSHMKLTAPAYTYEIGSASFELKNLFNGNKELSDTTHEMANRNWKLLMDDFGPPGIKQVATKLVKSINKFFLGVPIQNMVLNYPVET